MGTPTDPPTTTTTTVPTTTTTTQRPTRATTTHHKSYRKHNSHHNMHGYRPHNYRHPWGRDLTEEDQENATGISESDNDETLGQDEEESEGEPEPCEDNGDDMEMDTSADLISQENDRQIMSSASFFCRGFFNTQFCGIFGL